MGTLYKIPTEVKKAILIKELAAMNVEETVRHISIHLAEYEDLQETIVNEVLKRARTIDISADANRFF